MWHWAAPDDPRVPWRRLRAVDLDAGVLAVLRGLRDSFSSEYTTQSGKEARWWSFVVVPLDRPEGGAVVTRADVTDLRRAELDVQRSRQELAHVGRVRIRKAPDSESRHKRALVFFGLALLVLLLSMPWPIGPGARSLFRGL